MGRVVGDKIREGNSDTTVCNKPGKDMVGRGAFLDPELEAAHWKGVADLDKTDLKILIFCLLF